MIFVIKIYDIRIIARRRRKVNKKIPTKGYFYHFLLFAGSGAGVYAADF